MSVQLGESQWFQPTIRNRLWKPVVLLNFSIQYGKFYDIKNPYNETVSAQGTQIEGKAEFEWGHCGRQASPTGTESSFEVYLAGTNERIAQIYWDCPFIGSNKIEKRYVKPGYLISTEGFSIPSGALGKGTISILED